MTFLIRLKKLIEELPDVINKLVDNGENLLKVILNIVKSSLEFLLTLFSFFIDLVLSNKLVIETFILIIPIIPLVNILYNFLLDF